MTDPRRPPLRLLTLRHMDGANRNAQSLTARAILPRLPTDRFAVTAFCEDWPDPCLALAAHVRVHRLPRRLRTASIVLRARLDGTSVLFHPQADRYDTRIDRLLALSGRRHLLVVHVVLSVDPPHASDDYLRHVGDQIGRAALLTANSDHVADGVERRFGRRPLTVENGVDLGVFRPQPDVPPISPVMTVAVVGSFQPRKRHDLVVAAARRLPQVRFWCAGSGPGPERAPLESLLRAEGVLNVEILDPMSSTALAKRLARSHVLFHPSDHEGAPQVLLQAQACGCVPVARRVYRPPTIRDGVSGVLCDDDEGLLAALEGLPGDPGRWMRLRAAGLEEAASRSWDDVAGRWAILLDGLRAPSAAAPGERAP